MQTNTGWLCVITINYNNRAGLIDTFDSIRRQSCRDFEYIVVDGGSTDGSVEVIREHADLIDRWVSEPDGGIYNAMNKGVGMYDGDGYIIFMNSGDRFYSERTVQQIRAARPRADVACGGWVGVIGGGGGSARLFTPRIRPMCIGCCPLRCPIMPA